MLEIKPLGLRTVGQAADDNTAYKLCMLDTQGYKLTPRICNTYCFPTTTMVARTRLNATLYLHCLSWYLTINDNLHYAKICDAGETMQ